LEFKAEKRKEKGNESEKKGKELIWPKPTKPAHQLPAHGSPASLPLRFRGGNHLLPRLCRMVDNAWQSSTTMLSMRSTPDARF
jgi:hypothetical protein